MTRRALLAALAATVPGMAALQALDERAALAMIISEDQVRCATCHYWNGVRKAPSQHQVDASYDGTGRCDNMDSPYHNLSVGTLHFCPAYRRWDKLD
jgi:hypothetical protein